MSNPTVSIIVPCYNLGRYLDEAVESVLAQTFHDAEILIVDDGSTDPATRSLVNEYRKPKTRVVRTENRGLPAAKNLGISMTTGRYVCALDADDRLEPTMLEKSVAVLEADPSIAFVSHWLRNFGDDTSAWMPTSCDFPALLDMNTVNGAAVVRRSAVQAVGGYDETFRDGCEDWDFWITLVERGLAGRILPEVLFAYRRRSGSMSQTMLDGVGHAALYRRLVQKHVDIYRHHLPTLLARRERDGATLRREIEGLDFDHVRWTTPELAKRRDDVVMLERKREFGATREERDELRLSLVEAVAGARSARARVDDLERSMSWRLTAPMRTVYGQILRVKGLFVAR